MVQTWRDRAPGFSAMTERGAQSPETLLMAIAPPPPPRPKDPPIIILPPEEPAWYRDRRVQVSVGLGVALVVVAAVVWARSGVDMKAPNPDIQGQ